MVLSLSHLPEEILHSILYSLHPRFTAALEQTSHYFRNVAQKRLLWRYYCKIYYTTWDSKHVILHKFAIPVSEVDWKALFVLRYRIDREVTANLDSILLCQTGRIEKFRRVIGFGYDAKDTLSRHSTVETGEDHLARRYYAQALLSCLHRNIAIPEWAKLRHGEPISLECGLGAFDLFIPESGYGNFDEIRSRLTEIAIQFNASHPDIEFLSPRNEALLLASWLRENNLTGIEPGREYHSLDHNFLGLALSSSGHNSLPLISAAIYCYLAQSLGLNAQLCRIPFHVYVTVTPQEGFDMDGNSLRHLEPGPPIYIDPSREPREIPASELRDQLVFYGASNTEQAEVLSGSVTSEIILRCSRNILNSVDWAGQHPNIPPTVDVVSARYAALWSSMLLSGISRPADLRHQLPWLMEMFATDFPCDIFMIEEYIAPLFQGDFEHEHILESLQAMRSADMIPKQVHRRSAENKNILYRVGQVFRHRRYHYQAIITGWDSEYGAGDEWMRRMGIDNLQAGRHQSFYHVLVEDRTVRYVAEENIEPFLPNVTELSSNLMSLAGKHFKRWDEVARAFVSNVRDEYPDD